MVSELRGVTRLLLGALVATVVLFVSPAAWAAAVPMCGEDAQTVAAPPPMQPSKGHVLDSVPCPDRDQFDLGHHPGDGPRPPASVVDDGPQRVCPSAFRFARAPRSARLDIASELLKPRHGFVHSIERPPRLA